MLIANSLFTPDFSNLTVHGGEKVIINEKSFSSEFSLCFLQYSLGSMWFNQHKKVLVFKKPKSSFQKSHETILLVLQLYFVSLKPVELHGHTKQSQSHCAGRVRQYAERQQMEENETLVGTLGSDSEGSSFLEYLRKLGFEGVSYQLGQQLPNQMCFIHKER